MSYAAYKGTRPGSRLSEIHYRPPTTEDQFSTVEVDHYAVERAVSGEQPRVELTTEEKRIAALFLRRHDVPRLKVSEQLCVYEQLVRDWEAEAGMLAPEQLCIAPGCPKARAGRGYCSNHLQQVRVLDRQWKAALAELGMAA